MIDANGKLHKDAGHSDGGQFAGKSGGASKKKPSGLTWKKKSTESAHEHHEALGGTVTITKAASYSPYEMHAIINGQQTKLGKFADLAEAKSKARELIDAKLNERKGDIAKKIPASDHQAIANRIHEAGQKLKDTFGGTPNQDAPYAHKVFLSDIYDAIKDDLDGVPLEDFKKIALHMNRKDLIRLSRLDLVSAVHPDEFHKIKKSEINHYGNSEFAGATLHSVQIPRPQGEKKHDYAYGSRDTSDLIIQKVTREIADSTGEKKRKAERRLADEIARRIAVGRGMQFFITPTGRMVIPAMMQDQPIFYAEEGRHAIRAANAADRTSGGKHREASYQAEFATQSAKDSDSHTHAATMHKAAHDAHMGMTKKTSGDVQAAHHEAAKNHLAAHQRHMIAAQKTKLQHASKNNVRPLPKTSNPFHSGVGDLRVGSGGESKVAVDKLRKRVAIGKDGKLARPEAAKPKAEVVHYAEEGSGGRWVTIGTKGADGKRHGGSPVFIQGGRIVKGHPSLTGKKLGNLKGDSESGTHRQQMNQSKGHARAVWAKKARKEGFKSADLHQLASDMKAHHDAHASDVHSLLRHARSSKLANVHHAKLAKEFDGGDYTKIPGFDELARSLAGQFPHILGAHGYEQQGEGGDQSAAAEKLFELLRSGNPEVMSEDDAYQQAFDHLMEHQEVIPFALDEERIDYASLHAPIGGATINGTFYKGGEFIPHAEMAKATEQEKTAIKDDSRHLSVDYKPDYPGNDGKQRKALYRPGQDGATLQGNDTLFNEHYAEYVRKHIEHEVNSIKKAIDDAFANGEDLDPEEFREEIDGKFEELHEAIDSHVEHFKEEAYKHAELAFGEGEIERGNWDTATDYIDEHVESLKDRLDSFQGAFQETLEEWGFDKDTFDNDSRFAWRQVEADLSTFDRAMKAAADDFNSEIEDSIEAETDEQQSAVSNYFDDLQGEIEGELEDVDDDDQKAIDEIWNRKIKEYNAMIFDGADDEFKDNPFRIGLNDDGELEVMHGDDLPDELKPDPPKKVNITPDGKLAPN